MEGVSYGNQYKHVGADGGPQPLCITEHAGQSRWRACPLVQRSFLPKMTRPVCRFCALTRKSRRTSAASANVKQRHFLNQTEDGFLKKIVTR